LGCCGRDRCRSLDFQGALAGILHRHPPTPITIGYAFVLQVKLENASLCHEDPITVLIRATGLEAIIDE
jgi:hypothetical protein